MATEEEIAELRRLKRERALLIVQLWLMRFLNVFATFVIILTLAWMVHRLPEIFERSALLGKKPQLLAVSAPAKSADTPSALYNAISA